MTPIGVGTDIVEIVRITSMIERHGDRFTSRIFTDAERRYAEQDARRDERLAARFAAKEAVMKSIGVGWGRVSWQDIEVTREPSGQPGVSISGGAAALAEQRGVRSFLLSMSHTGGYATATAIALG